MAAPAMLQPEISGYTFDHLAPYASRKPWDVIRGECRTGRAAYAYPARETAELIAAHGSHRLLEVAAGSGLMTRALREAGFDVIASDPMLGTFEDGGHAYHFTYGEFAPLLVADGKAAIEAHPERDVLLVMPGPSDSWFAEAIKSIRPGRRLFLHLDGNPDWDPDAITGKRALVMKGTLACLRVLRTMFREIGRAPIFSPDKHGLLVAYEKTS